jgi:cell wall-associated NlpC family hydrolase
LSAPPFPRHCRSVIAATLAIALGACASTRPASGPPAAPSAEPPISFGPGPGPAAVDAPSAMVDAAVSMLGQPYRFGGAAPGGFDCSGLVVFSANAAGFHVPRTAREQMGSGTPVARDDLRPGDLVFMHLAHKELHVGIAIGKDRFVHAPATGGRVRIDSLDVAPYAHGYLRARRLIAAP